MCICLLLPVHHQVTAKYFSEYNISSITISMYAPGQEEGETVVTCSLELPEDAVDSVINRYSNSRKKRDFEFLQEPVIYGFRPASVLECAVYSVEMFCVMCWKVLCMLCFVFECVCVCFVIFFILKTLMNWTCITFHITYSVIHNRRMFMSRSQRCQLYFFDQYL